MGGMGHPQDQDPFADPVPAQKQRFLRCGYRVALYIGLDRFGDGHAAVAVAVGFDHPDHAGPGRQVLFHRLHIIRRRIQVDGGIDSCVWFHWFVLHLCVFFFCRVLPHAARFSHPSPALPGSQRGTQSAISSAKTPCCPWRAAAISPARP